MLTRVRVLPMRVGCGIAPVYAEVAVKEPIFGDEKFYLVLAPDEQALKHFEGSAIDIAGVLSEEAEDNDFLIYFGRQVSKTRFLRLLTGKLALRESMDKEFTLLTDIARIVGFTPKEPVQKLIKEEIEENEEVQAEEKPEEDEEVQAEENEVQTEEKE